MQVWVDHVASGRAEMVEEQKVRDAITVGEESVGD